MFNHDFQFFNFLMPPPLGLTPICPYHVFNLFYVVLECYRGFYNVLECLIMFFFLSFLLPPPMGFTPIRPHHVSNLFYEVIVLKSSRMFYHDFFCQVFNAPPPLGLTQICPHHISNLFYEVSECSRRFQNVLVCYIMILFFLAFNAPPWGFPQSVPIMLQTCSMKFQNI